jgi:selenide,water dikinase
MEGFDVHAATDVTGYGLLGHAHEMMEASRATARFFVEGIPLISPARRLAARGVAPDGSRVNLRNLRPRLQADPEITEEDLLLLCDAQTSGGLLVALPAEQAPGYAARCRERGAGGAAVIGRVEKRGAALLAVQRQEKGDPR